MLEEGREAYAQRQWERAYRQLSAVRRELPLDPDDLAALADAAWWLGDTDESLACSEELYRRLLDAGRGPAAARVAIEVGFLWLLRGEQALGSGWVSRAVRLLDEAPECAEHGYLLYLEVEELLGRGDHEAAVATARRMQRLAARHGDDTLAAVGLVLEGTARIRDGGLDDGLTLVDEAMLSVRAGAVQPNWAGNLYCHLMSLFVGLGDIPRARAWTDATERWCDEHSNPAMFVGICRVHRAQLLHLEGAWPAAERAAARACRELADMNVEVVAEGHYQLGELHRRRGDLHAAEEAYERADRLGRDPQPGRALLRLAQGRARAAARELHTALLATWQATSRAPLLAARVEVAAALGDHALVAEAADELVGITDAYATPGLLAASRQASGVARLARGEPERALPLLRDARRRWQQLGAPCDEAVVRVHLASALRALGDEEGAGAELAAAREAFTRLGAAGELRRLTAPRQRARLPKGLTSREVQVLAAVAAGATNRAVADQLTISERTVERHLSNIFGKLGVASRTEAAAFAFAHDLADPTDLADPPADPASRSSR